MRIIDSRKLTSPQMRDNLRILESGLAAEATLPKAEVLCKAPRLCVSSLVRAPEFEPSGRSGFVCVGTTVRTHIETSKDSHVR